MAIGANGQIGVNVTSLVVRVAKLAHVTAQNPTPLVGVITALGRDKKGSIVTDNYVGDEVRNHTV